MISNHSLLYACLACDFTIMMSNEQWTTANITTTATTAISSK